MTHEEMVAALGRKWRVNAVSLSRLYSYYRKVAALVVPIPVRSRRLKEILGCDFRQVAKTVRKGVECGLLEAVDHTYRFNAYERSDNRCRTYRFSPGAASEVVSLANSSLKPEEEVRGRENILRKEDTAGLEEDETGYPNEPGKLPEISCRKEYDMKEADIARALEALSRRYPQIPDTQKKLEEMNSALCEDDHWFYTYMEPHFRPGKGRFSVRACSELCSVKKVPSRPDELYRGYLLDDFFGPGAWDEYDLNASIYRIARSCRDGRWYSDPGDIYETLHGGPFAGDLERDEFKGACMVAAFSADTRTACSAYRRKFWQYRHASNDQVTAVLEPVREAILDFCGPVDTDVFMHESCIMASVAYRLFRSGVKAVQLYDCLFAPRGMEEEFAALMDGCFAEYYGRYLLREKD